MLFFGNSHVRSTAGRIAYVVVVLLCAVSFVRSAAGASNNSQTFETWPATGAWGTTMHEGWTLSDGQVKGGRGGFGPPLGGTGQCGWLYDFDDSTNSWLQSPAYAPGVLSVSFWTRQDTTLATNSTIVLEQSSNQVDWTAVEAFTIDNFDWMQQTSLVDSVGNTYVRIRKTGDDGADTYAGLDDILVTPRPAVFLSNLDATTGVPTLPEDFDILVDVLIHPTGSNVIISAFYRHGTNDAFTEIAMSLDAGETYRTTSRVPFAGFANGVEYYLQAVFDEGGPSLVFLPPGGSNAPAIYSILAPTGETPPRQLSSSSQFTPFIFSEIMYHPADTPESNSLEYIELFNTDPLGRDISEFRITGDVDYKFPPNTKVEFRSYVVVARDPDAVEQAYGLQNVFGPYTNNLPNNGGRVRLRNRLGQLLLDVNYDDQLPWTIAADGAGHSLQLARPDYGEESVLAWQASAYVGGSPGKLDPFDDDPIREVMINEYLAHTDLPDTDYIELYNSGTQAVDISGCGLANTVATNEFFVPPGTILQPGGHVSYDQATLGFSLSAGGDEVFFWAPDFSNVIDAVRFDAQVNGVPSGRIPDGAPTFHALDAQTPGTTNAAANLLTSDVVINEIMYAPLSGKQRDEYVELHNKGSNAVDVSYWRFVEGIEYLFPPGTVIPAGGYLVIAEDVQNLLSKYVQLNTGNTLGDYSGMLSDSGERVALAKPDDPGLPFEDFVIVDEVTYSDGERWGKWADGGGSSLELVDPRSDNRLAMNWRGSDETAKSSWMTIESTGDLDIGGASVIFPTANMAAELNVLIPNVGECLVDDIEVIKVGEGVNRIVNSAFDTGIAGWTPDGSHRLSTYNATNGFGGSGCLHVKSSAGGAIKGYNALTEINHVYATLTQQLDEGEEVTIRAKARWLAGWPVLVLGLDGYFFEAAVEFDLPVNLGTPGLQNSRFAGNTGPAIFDMIHHPILPAAGESATVTCRAHDPDGLLSLSLEYRVDPSQTYTGIAMLDDGTGGDVLAADGIYSAQIPGMPAGDLVCFRVRAEDDHAIPVASYFPAEAIKKNALVRFGEPTPSGLFPAYAIWISNANIVDLIAPIGRNDHEEDMTLVYQNHRAIYNGGMRFRGNNRVQFGFHNYDKTALSCSVPKSDRFMGNNEFKVDVPSSGPDDPSNIYVIHEYHGYWVGRQADMASSHLRFINASVNGTENLRQDLQTPTRYFCKRSYGDDDPHIYKHVRIQPFDDYVRDDGTRAMAAYRFGIRKKRTTIPSDSYKTLFSMVDASKFASPVVYEARLAALVDHFGFGAFLAVNHVIANGDSFGSSAGSNNLMVYLSLTHRGRLHLVDLDTCYRSDSSNAATRPLFGGGTPTGFLYGNIMSFRRAYWRVLQNIMQRAYDPAAYLPELAGWYDIFQANNIEALYPQNMIDWNAAMHSRITNDLPRAPFVISGGDFNTTDHIAVIGGTAPIEVASFRLNGRDMRVTYPTQTNWSARVGLEDGANAFVIEGFDYLGHIVASDSITVTLTTAAPSPVDQLLISEIMYHPFEQQAEFVEIYNRSSNSFDLGGWRMNGVGYEFEAGAVIDPGEYLVLAENATAYQHAYANAEVLIGDYGGNLDNGGETLTLEMPVGSNAWMEIDKVRYEDSGAWSTNADGTGASLQLIDINADNSRAGNWGVVPAPLWDSRTPGFANSNAASLFAFPPVWINEVMPSNTSTVADNHGEFEPWIELYNADTVPHNLSLYRLSNDYQDLDRWAFPAGTVIAPDSRICVWADGETNETDVGFLHADFRLNSASGSVILAREWLGSTVVVDYLDYDLVAPDNSFGSFPDGDPFSRVIFPTPTPSMSNSLSSPPIQVVVNEWMADNQTFLADPSDGSFDDWFELFNLSAIDANLGGHYLTDNLSVTNMFAVPSGTIVPANGFLFVWADNDEAVNGPGQDLHVNFGLSRNGDTIGLYSPAGGLVDAVVFGAQGNDQSDGSWPDGTVDIYPMLPSTPAGSNSVFLIIQCESGPGGHTVDVAVPSAGVYRVEFNVDVINTNWMLLDIVTADTSVLTFTDTNVVSVPARFYRLLEN
jgi:hypothetical protein